MVVLSQLSPSCTVQDLCLGNGAAHGGAHLNEPRQGQPHPKNAHLLDDSRSPQVDSHIVRVAGTGASLEESRAMRTPWEYLSSRASKRMAQRKVTTTPLTLKAMTQVS